MVHINHLFPHNRIPYIILYDNNTEEIHTRNKNTANGNVAHRLLKEALNFIICKILKIAKKIKFKFFFKTAYKLQTYGSNEPLCQI